MDSSAVRQSRIGLLGGRSPLLRFQSDERLIALIRSGHEGAFELLFERYRPRLLAFCRHMLGSKEDAEDVLQEVFAASYNAMRADDRTLHVRPWLYRIARNRCLNHLRRPRHDGRDTMDDQIGANGASAADLVHKRVDFRHLLEDIHKLPETQRTALLLREIDVLSYEQIADAMETTVPSVKSLLVRARMSLAEAAEARQLTCNDVRRELAEIVEGLKKTTPPIRRHLRDCEQCARYRTQLRKTNTAMAFAFPLGPVLIMKKLFLAKLGAAAAAGGSSAATGGAAAGGAAAGGAAAGGAAAGGLAAGGAGTAVPLGLGALATKAITVTAATVVLAGGAVEVHRIATPHREAPRPAVAQPGPQPELAPDAQATGPVSAVPLVENKDEATPQDAAKTKDDQKKNGDSSNTASEKPLATPEDQSALSPTGTTDPAVPTDGSEIAPVEGQSAPPPDAAQTGGAALPPSEPQSEPAAGGNQAPPK